MGIAHLVVGSFSSVFWVAFLALVFVSAGRSRIGSSARLWTQLLMEADGFEAFLWVFRECRAEGKKLRKEAAGEQRRRIKRPVGSNAPKLLQLQRMSLQH